MVLAANVFSLCLWPGLRAKRFTLGAVSFQSYDWIIFVFKFQFFKNLAKIFSFSVVVLLEDNVTDHIKNKLTITKDQRSDIVSNLFGDNGIINTDDTTDFDVRSENLCCSFPV
jgi:hypothetical protein